MAEARLINKKIILSRKLNSVSEGAENLYYRLLVISDDFGCYHADPDIIKGQAYTLRKITPRQIWNRLRELVSIRLIKMYQIEGEIYIEITKFEAHQRFRKDIKRKNLFPSFQQGSRYEPVTTWNVPSSSVNKNHNRNRNRSNHIISSVVNKYCIKKDNNITPDSRNILSPPHCNQKKEIIFNFKTGKFEGILKKDISGWEGAYPACDIMLEIKKAAQYMIANPKKKKKNWRRYITGWLNRTQEKGGTRGFVTNKSKDEWAKKKVLEGKKDDDSI